jgi:hypothetical protein
MSESTVHVKLLNMRALETLILLFCNDKGLYLYDYEGVSTRHLPVLLVAALDVGEASTCCTAGVPTDGVMLNHQQAGGWRMDSEHRCINLQVSACEVLLI